MSLLDMKGCDVVSTSPDCARLPNIFHSVQPRTEIELDLLLLIDSLKQNKNNTSCVIVYCSSLNICSDIYATFHYELGQDSYYPCGSEQNSVLGNALTI